MNVFAEVDEKIKFLYDIYNMGEEYPYGKAVCKRVLKAYYDEEHFSEIIFREIYKIKLRYEIYDHLHLWGEFNDEARKKRDEVLEEVRKEHARLYPKTIEEFVHEIEVMYVNAYIKYLRLLYREEFTEFMEDTVNIRTYQEILCLYYLCYGDDFYYINERLISNLPVNRERAQKVTSWQDVKKIDKIMKIIVEDKNTNAPADFTAGAFCIRVNKNTARRR